MTYLGKLLNAILVLLVLTGCSHPEKKRKEQFTDFDDAWKFNLGNVDNAKDSAFDDHEWRSLNLPHDWSVEGKFSPDNAAGVGGGALPGGIGWYRKKFTIVADNSKKIFIEFDGVYRNSEVWLNGHLLGKRPNGYISFHYELTPFLNPTGYNVISVKVDNAEQPNSRWYSGSGIYRNVRLIVRDNIYIDPWETAITTINVSTQSAEVSIATKIRNSTESAQTVNVKNRIIDGEGKEIATTAVQQNIPEDSSINITQQQKLSTPALWSIETPSIYTSVTEIERDGKVTDRLETTFGIRAFEFDIIKGFILNGKSVKIKGVCLHHDLGALGAAINTRAIERQLEIMKQMGVNAIRTTHNPPAPELLDLCDKMGFIVMDEAFDMWRRGKNDFDYHLDWDLWHRRDLQAQILRDRNHPSVFIWSIGNEIGEQYNHKDSAGAVIARELAGIVRKLDNTRPITAACNDINADNPIIHSGALDLVGYNYHYENYEAFPKDHPGKKFIATETTSALETRGVYDMPSDSIRRWPIAWDKTFTQGNADNTVSAYDNVSTPWGSTHEETWKIIKKHDFLSGLFIWTGFDYLGEPTPYGWPSRSSYFGVVDLAGIPKDVFYMYQSEWTEKPMLYIFPHWNWRPGKVVDVWAYYNQADEVELFLNDKSVGVRKKQGDDLHVMWRIPFDEGTLRAVSRKNGRDVLVRRIKTAGPPARIIMEADRRTLHADGKDLCFVTIKIVDIDGNLVPTASSLLHLTVRGEGFFVGADNGNPVSHESFKSKDISTYNGKCVVIMQAKTDRGKIALTVTSEGLRRTTVAVDVK